MTRGGSEYLKAEAALLDWNAFERHRLATSGSKIVNMSEVVYVMCMGGPICM